MRDLRDDQGGVLAAGPVFAAYRDRTPTDQLPVEAALTKASGKAVAKLDKKCAALAGLVGLDATGFVAEAEAQVVSASASPCDPLDTTHCLFPTTNDYFSVGPMLLMDDQQLDLATTGAPPITDIATSLDASSPVVLIDAGTGEKQLLWVERDQSGSVPAEQPVMMRVGRNLLNDHRYIIAMLHHRDARSA
jgi:hypothetical protein